MGKVEKYKALVRDLLKEVLEIRTEQRYEIPTQLIMDNERGHYLLYKNGWEIERRYYGCFLHIDVLDTGKIQVNHDGTDLLVIQKIMDAGVPASDIIIGFHAPIMRPDTEFAVE